MAKKIVSQVKFEKAESLAKWAYEKALLMLGQDPKKDRKEDIEKQIISKTEEWLNEKKTLAILVRQQGEDWAKEALAYILTGNEGKAREIIGEAALKAIKQALKELKDKLEIIIQPGIDYDDKTLDPNNNEIEKTVLEMIVEDLLTGKNVSTPRASGGVIVPPANLPDLSLQPEAGYIKNVADILLKEIFTKNGVMLDANAKQAFETNLKITLITLILRFKVNQVKKQTQAQPQPGQQAQPAVDEDVTLPETTFWGKIKRHIHPEGPWFSYSPTGFDTIRRAKRRAKVSPEKAGGKFKIIRDKKAEKAKEENNYAHASMFAQFKIPAIRLSIFGGTVIDLGTLTAGLIVAGFFGTIFGGIDTAFLIMFMFGLSGFMYKKAMEKGNPFKAYAIALGVWLMFFQLVIWMHNFVLVFNGPLAIMVVGGMLLSVFFRETLLGHRFAAVLHNLRAGPSSVSMFGGFNKINEDQLWRSSMFVHTHVIMGGIIANVILAGLAMLFGGVGFATAWALFLQALSANYSAIFATGSFAQILIAMNLYLAAVNLLPFGILDGGRLVKAALYHWRYASRFNSNRFMDIGAFIKADYWHKVITVIGAGILVALVPVLLWTLGGIPTWFWTTLFFAGPSIFIPLIRD